MIGTLTSFISFNIIYIHSSAPATIFGQLWPGGHRSVLWLLLLSHLLHRLWQLCQCRAKPSTEGGAQGSKRRVGGGKNEIQSCWIFQAYFSGALPLREGSYFPPRGSKSAMAISQVFLEHFQVILLTKYTSALDGWWASFCTLGTAGSCWSARQCGFSSSGTLHLENRLAIRSSLHNVLTKTFHLIS